MTITEATQTKEILVRGRPKGQSVILSAHATDIPTANKSGILRAKIDGDALEVTFEFGDGEFHHTRLALNRLGTCSLQINANVELGIVVTPVSMQNEK